MLGYICKYTPVEIIEALGGQIERFTPHVSDFHRAEAMMHANMCSFSKAVLEDFADSGYEGLVLTTCCDSVRRLYDVLKHKYPNHFFYMVDLPRKVNDFAISFYEKQIRGLAEAYAAFSGKELDYSGLYRVCEKRTEASGLKKAPADGDSLRIGLCGARPGPEIRNEIENHGARIVFDMTCTGMERSFSGMRRDPDVLLRDYSSKLLGQLPCMRMARAVNREQFLAGMADEIDGLVYHTIKFCDIYAYEYTPLKNLYSVPILKIETDATMQGSGQILTRLEAFFESLREKKEKPPVLIPAAAQEKGEPMYVLGIDSGSTSTNAVLMNSKKEIVAFSVLRTGAKSTQSAQRILEDILDKAQLAREDISVIVSTGYGRVSIPFADRDVTEISCHGRGAYFLNPQVKTILDIGGQDSKAIRLGEKGEIADFVMNDKCAAGTGRFLEMMARTLEIPLEELGSISLQSKQDVTISSMCSVFAESEVISLIAQNKETADIAHGIHEAIAGRAISLIKRVGAQPGFMMTGGVAKNPGMVDVLEKHLDAKLYIYEEPEIVGAIGAALYGFDSFL